MSWDTELDRAEQDQAYRERQEAYQRWHNRLEKQNCLYREKEVAKKACDDAKKRMNAAYNDLHRYDRVWDDYHRIRDTNNMCITELKSRADSLAYQMKAAFQKASEEYNFGDRSLAPGYSAEGNRYKTELDSLNTRISSLGAEVKNARLRAESCGCQDSSAFHNAKARFEETKKEQEQAQEKLNIYSAETRKLKAEFESAKRKHLRIQETFHERLAAVKAAKKQRQSEEDRLMDQAEIPYYYRKSCKVRRSADGTVNFYFGGIGESDGLGHGHISMDNNGKVTYNRDVFDKHGTQNYMDYKERLSQYKETHTMSWQIQDENEDYIVKVKGDYLYDNLHLGKDPDDIERTDFLIFPKATPGMHAHLSVGDDTDGEVTIWHDVEERPGKRRRRRK